MAVFFRIHDAEIHAMHAPGGPVYDLIESVSRTAAELARVHVGKRTGKLMSSIRHNRPSQHGGYSIAGLVYANARHALWHHEGTYEIFATHGKYLTIPKHRQLGGNASGGDLRRAYFAAGGRKSKSPKPYFLRESISGQRANPFLRDGVVDAMRANPHLAHTGNV
jgi:hypothetical protein